MTALQILDFRQMRKNSLLGFAKVELPSGLIINDVTILSGERGPWASPPSKPMVDRNGVVMKDSNRKLRYTPIIDFVSKHVCSRFSDAVIKAVRATHPEAFGSDVT